MMPDLPPPPDGNLDPILAIDGDFCSDRPTLAIARLQGLENDIY
jgi:hypothetical protein